MKRWIASQAWAATCFVVSSRTYWGFSLHYVATRSRRTIMLKRIPPILSPELLYLIARMGHGDELVIADANFPAEANAKRLVRADGHGVTVILEAVLQLFPLDKFVTNPAAVMRRVDKPGEPAPIWNEFQRVLDSAEGRH